MSEEVQTEVKKKRPYVRKSKEQIGHSPLCKRDTEDLREEIHKLKEELSRELGNKLLVAERIIEQNNTAFLNRFQQNLQHTYNQIDNRILEIDDKLSLMKKHLESGIVVVQSEVKGLYEYTYSIINKINTTSQFICFPAILKATQKSTLILVGILSIVWFLISLIFKFIF